MTLMQRSDRSTTTAVTPDIIAVLRADDADRYDPVVRILAENGISGIELTLRTPGTMDRLETLRNTAPSGAKIGVGTVTTVEQVRRVLSIGADFIVTPVTDLEVIAAAVDAGVPIYPGGLTPTELLRGWNAGATAVKVFPASLVGPDYLAGLRGPFPDIQVVPSGGLGLTEAEAWIRAGATGVSIGSPLLGDALRGGDPTSLAHRCARFVEAVHNGRQPR